MTTPHTLSQRDLKQVIAHELAAFEQKENAMKASERRERARALGLPLSLVSDTPSKPTTAS